LAERAFNANNPFTRFKGLLGTSELPSSIMDGLYLDPCNGIHMFWMAYAIDALFFDKDLTVVACVDSIKPWAISKVYKQAHTCLELPAGFLATTGTAPGDKIIIAEPVSGA
jgi:uncharacterized membrane protein (UPF0127 family)